MHRWYDTRRAPGEKRGRADQPGQRRETAAADPSLTFLNIMSEHTDRAVNSAAISSMMMPTGILVLRPVRAAIQPLADRGQRQSEPGCGTRPPAEVQRAQRQKSKSPRSPAGDADRLQDVNAKLTDIHKKEDEEAERTVAPGTEAEKKGVRAETEARIQ